LAFKGLIWHTWDRSGARLSDISDYQMVPLLICVILGLHN